MSSWKVHNLYHLAGFVILCLGYFNFSLITEAINIFFQISYLTGQLLVNKFLTVCSCTVEIAKLGYSFFQILYEDSLIFIKDATEKFTFAILILKQCYLFLEEGVQRVVDYGYKIISLILNIAEAAFGILGFLHYTVASLKDGLHLLGLTIWRSITLIPETILLNVNATHDFIKETLNKVVNSFFVFCDEAFQSLEKTYLSMFDISLDSIYGLIIGAVFVILLCIKFKDICLVASSAFLKLYQHAISFGVSLWTGRFLERKVDRNMIVYNPEDDERLCVICQYQSKEIIIFPCKHLCLCADCSNQLTKNQHTCPICRSHIRGTLKVYL